jgi:hypothetical protein
MSAMSQRKGTKRQRSLYKSKSFHEIKESILKMRIHPGFSKLMSCRCRTATNFAMAEEVPGLFGLYGAPLVILLNPKLSLLDRRITNLGQSLLGQISGVCYVSSEEQARPLLFGLMLFASTRMITWREVDRFGG